MTKLITRSELARLAGVHPSTITEACQRGHCLAAGVVGNKVDRDHPDVQAYLIKRSTPPEEELATGIDPKWDAAVACCAEAGRWSMRFLWKETGLGLSRKRATAISKAAQSLGLDKQPAPARVPKKEAPRPREQRGNGVVAERKKLADSDPTTLHELTIPENIREYADMTIRDVVYKFGTAPRFIDHLRAIKEIEAIEDKRLRNEERANKLVAKDAVDRLVVQPIVTMLTQLERDGVKTLAQEALAVANGGGDVVELEKSVAKVIASFVAPTKTKIVRGLKNV